MLGVINTAWLVQNSQRAYPLADDSTRLDVTGSFSLPNDFILSLYLAVHAGNDVSPGKFFIRKIGSYATGYTVFIGYNASSDPVDVATAIIPAATHVPGTAYTLQGLGDFNDAVGTIVIGATDNINQQPSGLFEFSLAGGRLEVDAIRPMLRALQSVTVVNGANSSNPITGILELVAGTNISLVPIIVSGQDPKIQINAIDGEGLTDTCECTETTGVPIRRINGVSPTPQGEFVLIGDECLNISEVTNGLKLSDLCSKPCCGCTELAVITEDLERLDSQVATLAHYVTTIEASVEQMNLVVLGSRLNDQTCVECE